MNNKELKTYLELYGREWINSLSDDELVDILLDGMTYAAKRDFENFCDEWGYIGYEEE